MTGGIVARSTRQLPTISSFLLQATKNGALRHHSNGKDIVNLQVSFWFFFATVNELPSVHSLNTKESLSHHAVLVWGHGNALLPRELHGLIMHNVSNNKLNTAMSLRKVHSLQ